MVFLLRLSLFYFVFVLFLTLSFAAAMPTEGNKAPEVTGLFEPEDTPPEEVTFSFLQSFSEARAEQRKKSKIFRGEWKGNGFEFEGAPGQPEFFINDQTMVSTKPRPAIWVLIKPGHESSLIFSKIPPSRRVRIFYAIPDFNFEGQGKALPSFIQIEVLVGKKKIFEAQTNTKGWREKTLDLTLPYLLHRDYQITFRLRSLDQEPRFIVLYGYMQ